MENSKITCHGKDDKIMVVKLTEDTNDTLADSYVDIRAKLFKPRIERTFLPHSYVTQTGNNSK